MSRAPHAPLFVREMGLPARLAVYVLISLLLAALDSRYNALDGLRSGLNTVIDPVKMALAQPWAWAQEMGGFFITHGELQQENDRLRASQEHLLALQQDRRALVAENAQLRALLSLPARPGVTPLVAEIVETVPDPFARKVIINRGLNRGIEAGRPVVDATGLVGQVTRVYPFSAEVTLLTDRDQGAPVLDMRNGLRAIVSGTGSDSLLEIRFLDLHADLKPGDLLYTSGIDGVYPAGVPVAQVIITELPRHTPFARAVCRPLGGVGRYRQVAVLNLAASVRPSSRPVGKSERRPAGKASGKPGKPARKAAP
jgi:rod shape-determining protein MreC